MTVTIDGLKGILAYTADIGSADDSTLQQILDGAQNYVEVYIGKTLASFLGLSGTDPMPAALIQAVYQLAAHWWEIRGAAEAADLMKAAPHWVASILTEFRKFTF